METRHQRVVTDLRRTWWTVSPFPARGLSVAANFDKENVSPVSLFERERERGRRRRNNKASNVELDEEEEKEEEESGKPLLWNTHEERERERDGREIGREGIAA